MNNEQILNLLLRLQVFVAPIFFGSFLVPSIIKKGYIDISRIFTALVIYFVLVLFMYGVLKLLIKSDK